MESSEKIKNANYVESSINLINSFIEKNELRKAFGFLILVLNKLEDNADRNEIITYYNKNLMNLKIFKANL